jgi:cell shape-determining protein MreD
MTNLGHVYVLKSKYRDELNNLKKERKMNSTLLVNIFRFILLLAVQIVIFNNMNFLGFNAASLSAVYYFISVNGNRSGLLITSFLLGLTMDVFSNSGGYTQLLV